MFSHGAIHEQSQERMQILNFDLITWHAVEIEIRFITMRWALFTNNVYGRF